jgi:hypothetical protein
VQTDVTKPAKPKKPGSQGRQAAPAAGPKRAETAKPSPQAAPKAEAADPDAPSIIVYRQDKIEEANMPNQPGVKLRRTTIDEVIVVKKQGAS